MAQLESFFLGIITALGALLIELLAVVFLDIKNGSIGSSNIAGYLALPLIIVCSAFIEEFAKFLIISRRISLFSQGRELILNSLLLGMGFFAIEFIFILLKDTSGQSILYPLIGTMLLHITTAGLIGYNLGSKVESNKNKALTTLLFVTIIHSSYNLLIQNNTAVANYLIYFLLVAMVFTTIFNLSRSNGKLAV